MNLIGDALHGRARAHKSGQERFERPFEGRRRIRLPVAGLAEIESLTDYYAQRAKSLERRDRERARRRQHRKARALVRSADRFGRQQWRPGSTADRRPHERPSCLGVAARHAEQLNLSARGPYEKHRSESVGRLQQSRRAIARQQRWYDSSVHDAPDKRVVAVHLNTDVGRQWQPQGRDFRAAVASARSGDAPTTLQKSGGVGQVSVVARDRAPAAAASRPSSR